MEKSIAIQELMNKLETFISEYKEILDKMSGLTCDKLLSDLQEAVKYKKGYYKNGKGNYIYIKGIEVTNDTGNLSRMGYNGEDRGVWIHYCLVDDRSVTYIDSPIALFSGCYFNEALFKTEELMHATTKEDFEDKVKKVIEVMTEDYSENINPKEYYDVANRYRDLCHECSDTLMHSVS